MPPSGNQRLLVELLVEVEVVERLYVEGEEVERGRGLGPVEGFASPERLRGVEVRQVHVIHLCKVTPVILHGVVSPERHPPAVGFRDQLCALGPASGRRGNNLKRFKNICLKAKASIWP